MTWWGRLLRRDRLERQLDAELRDHVDRMVADYVAEGMTEADARRRATLEFGGLDQVKELCRDARGTRWFDELVQDVRYGWRGFGRTPGFTAVAVITLAIGIGANAAVFSVINALMLRSLPVRDANELISMQRRQGTITGGHFSYPQVQELAKQNDLFSALCAFATDTVNVGAPEALEPTPVQFVSGGYYDTLGLSPQAGRLLTAADDAEGAGAAAVISDGYWTRRFGRSADAIGRSILIEGDGSADRGRHVAGIHRHDRRRILRSHARDPSATHHPARSAVLYRAGCSLAQDSRAPATAALHGSALRTGGRPVEPDARSVRQSQDDAG